MDCLHCWSDRSIFDYFFLLLLLVPVDDVDVQLFLELTSGLFFFRWGFFFSLLLPFDVLSSFLFPFAFFPFSLFLIRFSIPDRQSNFLTNDEILIIDFRPKTAPNLLLCLCHELLPEIKSELCDRVKYGSSNPHQV